ncbi:MAG: hypothetical protein RJA07_939 [Bacteroidota bacterium]|jgi:hypothetical protein
MKHISSRFVAYLSIGGSIASIASVIFFFTQSEKLYGEIALGLAVLLLLLFIGNVFFVLNKYLNLKYPKESHIFYKTIRYTCYEDRVEYEQIKTVQSKKLLLNEIKHEFKYTGTTPPEITNFYSKTHIIDELVFQKGDYDYAKLLFKEPLLYNQVGLIHIQINASDDDKKASPYVGFKVETQIHLVNVKIELKYKDSSFGDSAILQRQRIISNKPEEYEKIRDIAFDKATKSYSHMFFNPEVNYFYRITWEK